MAKKGIDISYCQTAVDWNKLKVDFVIMRAGYGKYASQKDNMFEIHYKNACNKGINKGAYWYSYAMSEAEAVQEAKACIEVLKGKKFEYPIYFDVEEPKQKALGKAKVSAIVKAFCSTMEAAGYWVGIYTNVDWYKNVITDDIKKRYAIWIANWGVAKPAISGPYGIWQYEVGRINGVSGNCDLDYGYVDYPTQIKKAGKNGYSKPPVPKPHVQKPPVQKPAKKKTISMTCTVDGVTYTGILTQK